MEISVERTPTPNVAATGTISALQIQNAELSTQIATLKSPEVISTSTPLIITPNVSTTLTPVPIPNAQRITFLDGATVGAVSAPIQTNQVQSYVLKAVQAQPMFVYVGSPSNDVSLSIMGQDGTTILSSAASKISWQGTLPQSGDYYLTVHGGALSENFSLTVTIPSRIQFAQGTDSSKLNGKTAAGYSVSYAVFASKGQNMNVDLGNLSGIASLSIYGFTDGQRYLQSDKGQTSYRFTLPSTQDYIIVVVPAANNVVSYTLTVTIK